MLICALWWNWNLNCSLKLGIEINEKHGQHEFRRVRTNAASYLKHFIQQTKWNLPFFSVTLMTSGLLEFSLDELSLSDEIDE